MLPPAMNEKFHNQAFLETLFLKIRRNCDVPPPMHEKFHYENFFETQGVPVRKFSALCDKKVSTEKRDTLALVHNYVPCQNISGTQVSPLRIFW